MPLSGLPHPLLSHMAGVPGDSSPAGKDPLAGQTSRGQLFLMELDIGASDRPPDSTDLPESTVEGEAEAAEPMVTDKEDPAARPAETDSAESRIAPSPAPGADTRMAWPGFPPPKVILAPAPSGTSREHAVTPTATPGNGMPRPDPEAAPLPGGTSSAPSALLAPLSIAPAPGARDERLPIAAELSGGHPAPEQPGAGPVAIQHVSSPGMHSESPMTPAQPLPGPQMSVAVRDSVTPVAEPTPPPEVQQASPRPGNRAHGGSDGAPPAVAPGQGNTPEWAASMRSSSIYQGPSGGTAGMTSSSLTPPQSPTGATSLPLPEVGDPTLRTARGRQATGQAGPPAGPVPNGPVGPELPAPASVARPVPPSDTPVSIRQDTSLSPPAPAPAPANTAIGPVIASQPTGAPGQGQEIQVVPERFDARPPPSPRAILVPPPGTPMQMTAEMPTAQAHFINTIAAATGLPGAGAILTQGNVVTERPPVSALPIFPLPRTPPIPAEAAPTLPARSGNQPAISTASAGTTLPTGSEPAALIAETGASPARSVPEFVPAMSLPAPTVLQPLAPQGPLAAPFAPPPVIRQLVEAHPGPGAGPVEITLAPEELGRVRMTVAGSETSLVMTIMAERDETISLIRRHLDLLVGEMREHGVRDIQFRFQDHPDRQGQGRGGSDTPNGASRDPGDTSSLPPAPSAPVVNDGLDLRL